ncbi:TPA: sulfatase [Candidatus Latescibacteria bacterium]|nr:sulfatase [Candidatus Latescibacterota bacterium]
MPDKPNLLYIHSDQHSPFVTGCYGCDSVDTPNLDALATRGAVLENVYCPSPICVPSRMSMLTGRYPHENHVWTNTHMLDSAIPTFAHAMGAAGYDPVLVGRMHSVGPDQLHGYAERYVGDHGPNYLGGVGANHGMLHGTAGPSRVSIRKSGIGQSAYQVHDEDVTASAIDYLNRLGVQKRAGTMAKPFSLSVGFMLPHQPFVARREDFERFADRVPPPQTPAPFSDDLHPHFKNWREKCGIVDVPDKEIQRARIAYWALVYRMDVMIGQILNTLRENGFEEDTLVIYSSDHGEQVGEHGLWWKQTFYDDSAKVPAIVAWPGRISEGSRINNVISSLDINATMIDALGCPALPTSRGRTLLPLFENINTDWDDVAFCEYCTDKREIQRMVRKGPWKLSYYHGQPSTLFNVDEDPRETRDRISDPECADIVRALTDRVLERWDPDAIWAEIQTTQTEARVMSQWTRNVKPADTHRWSLLPEMDYLE